MINLVHYVKVNMGNIAHLINSYNIDNYWKSSLICTKITYHYGVLIVKLEITNDIHFPLIYD